MEGQHVSDGFVGSSGNQSKGSSQALRLMEQKRTREGRSYEGQGTQDDSHVASSQGERTLSYVLKGSNHNDRDRKLENL